MDRITNILLVMVAMTTISVSFVSAGGGPIYIGDYCYEDRDCTYDISNSVCNVTDNSCVCKPGFPYLSKRICSHVLYDLYYPCYKDCDCSYYKDYSKCDHYMCVCQDGYKLQTDSNNDTSCVQDFSYNTPAKNIGNKDCSCKDSGSTRMYPSPVFLQIVILVLICTVLSTL